MLTLRKVGITGYPGSGKSTARQIFHKLGAYTLDCDKYVHDLLAKDPQIIDSVAKVLDRQNAKEINRKKLADIVFEDADKLAALQQILWPQVKKWIEVKYEQTQKKNYNLFVVEVPLLFEAKWESFFDTTIAVTCKRAPLHGNRKEWQRRMKHHLPHKEKLAHFAISNDGTIAELHDAIEHLVHQLTSNPKS